MPNRLSPEEVRRIQAQEKLVRELKEILYQNYSYVLDLPQVVKAINDGKSDFSFVKDKIVRKLLQKSLKSTHGKINVTLLNAVKREWDFAHEDFWKGFKAHFSKDRQQLKAYEILKSRAETELRNNSGESLKFYNQKRNGLNITDRVWNLTKAIPHEIEVMVQNGIKEGKSAADLARELRKNLNEPDRIYRRVRNKKTGKLELSEAAKKYNPGQGVYRSSVKNAERLARTEINQAYRQAEWNGYQKNDMIIGYKIRISNNSEGRCQTCVDLQGVYPKWFLWIGWHPHCRCRMVPVLSSQEDFKDEIKALFGGPAHTPKLIEKLPTNFVEYLQKNSERIRNASTLPYWYEDNLERIEEIISL